MFAAANDRTASRTAYIQAPEVLPGRSRTLKWRTYFLTSFSPHYVVSFGDSQGADNLAQWTMWTSSRVCF